MKTTTPVQLQAGFGQHSRQILSFVFGGLLAVGVASAQTAPTGIIQGRVYNPTAKEYVGNAEVRLEGTGQVTYTESDGSFRFDQVASGLAAGFSSKTRSC